MNSCMNALFHRTSPKSRRWVKPAIGESPNRYFEYEILEVKETPTGGPQWNLRRSRHSRLLASGLAVPSTSVSEAVYLDSEMTCSTGPVSSRTSIAML